MLHVHIPYFKKKQNKHEKTVSPIYQSPQQMAIFKGPILEVRNQRTLSQTQSCRHMIPKKGL